MTDKTGKLESLQRSPGELRWKLARRIPPLRDWAWRRLALRLSNEGDRRRLNADYNRLSLRKKKAFRSLYAKMFRDESLSIGDSHWDVEFAGRKVRIPLDEDSLWLDWDSALSILGHDIDVKLTYATLLESYKRPGTFLDVGASYGTHSLLHLVHGHDVYSIEPNPHCRAHFERWCTSNGVDGCMKSLALGAEEATLELSFPERDTWLGTLNRDIRASMEQGRELRVLRVCVRRLDDFVADHGISPDLVKIDTEGYEQMVLEGAGDTLRKVRPVVVFECREPERRKALADLLRFAEYQICTLPLLPGKIPHSLKDEQFQSSRAFNFAALPREHSLLAGTG